MHQIFPNHAGQLSRLNKIEGQIKGIRKMIEERRYCIEIVQQVKAVSSALKQVQLGLLETHIHHCLKDAVKTEDPTRLDEKINEVVRVLGGME